MIGALLALFFAATTSLDSPDKYLFTIPGTNITGKVNLESPILRSEDLSFLHEAYAERFVRMDNVGTSINSATNYYGACTNIHILLKGNGSPFSGRSSQKKVSGIWMLEHGITNTLSPPPDDWARTYDARYAGGIAPVEGIQRLQGGDIITAAVGIVASPLRVCDQCFTNFHASAYPKIAERQALFTAMGLLDKMVFNTPAVGGVQRYSGYYIGTFHREGSTYNTNWTESSGPTIYTNQFYGIYVSKSYDRIREVRDDPYLTNNWHDEDTFIKNEQKSYDTELTTNAVMSAGAYYMNTSNSADGVSAEIQTAAMVLKGDLQIDQNIDGQSTKIYEIAYFLVPVSLAFSDDRWLVSGTQWDDWFSASLGLLGHEVPKDDISEIPVPHEFEYRGENSKGWTYRLSCIGIVVGAKFKMRTEISP